MLNLNQKIKNFLRLTCREFMGMVVSIPLFTVILGAQNDFDTRKKINVPEPIYGCYFGSKILLQDEHLLISAPGYPDGSSFGAVYAYSFKDGLPVLRQKIINESGYSGEYFGQEMALDGTVLAVSGSYSGREVYIYRYNGFNWVKEQTLSVEGEYGFGYQVSVSGDRMVVGTYPNDCPANRAFVYRYNGTEWEMETILQPEGDPEIPEIGFGRGVAINEKTIAIGAPDEGGDFRGRIHLFEYDGAIWQPTDVISTNQSGIGESIELSSDLLVMGNPWAGIITIYRRTGNEWMFEQDITPSSADFWSNDGSHISISNDMIAVGIGPYEGSVNQVYLFKYERNRWDEKYVFTEDDFYSFGYSVCLENLVLLVGAPYLGENDHNNVGKVISYELISQPAGITVTNGTLTNRVRINWSSSTSVTESFKIYRDGEEIATILPGARSHNDYDAIPGNVYDYRVSAYCAKWGETIPKGTFGWRMPDGRIDGSTQTRYGAGVAQVKLNVTPTSGDITSALSFTADGDYSVFKNFTNFPDTALTVSFWMKSSDADHQGTPLSFCSPDNTDEFLIHNYQNLEIFLGQETTGPTGISLNDGQWHHLAVTWRSSDGTLTIYQDGVQAWQNTISIGDTLSAAGYLVLGQTQGKPGGDFQSQDAFQGLLDDVRIWKTARPAEQLIADMDRVLGGTEKNLLACWTFDDADRGPENIVCDFAAGGGHHMQLNGAVMLVDDTAPVEYSTYSDPYGDYSIKNLYYDESREYTISPSKPRHGFDPGERRRTLDRNNPTMTAVNFTDTTSFTISGRVVQKYGTAICDVAGAEIWLDGSFMGVKTDNSGSFIISVEEGGLHRLRPELNEHHFEPAEMILDVRDDIFNLEFEDTEIDTLSGYVRASCQTYIGQAGIRIYNQNNPPAAIDTILLTNLGSGYYQIVLPSRKYYTEVVSFVASDPLLIPRPEDVIEYFDVTPVDLTDSSLVQNFIYRKPPVIEITGWPEMGCAPFNVPLLEMDVVYPLTVEVYESFAGDRCLVDTGTVTIYDDVGTGNQDPVTLKLQGGTALYNITAGEPNILEGGAHPFQKLFQVEADVNGEKATTEIWVLVTGHRPREQTFATISPELPFLLLRDPPGDASYSYVNKDSELKQTVSFDLKSSFGLNTWSNIKLGCKMNLGWIAETVVEVWGSFRNAFEMKISALSQYEYAVSFKNSEKFTTSDMAVVTGESGDVYMGAALNLIYALTDVIAYDADSCKVDKSVALVVGSEGFATNFIYTENHIRNVLIPQLAQLRDIYLRSGSDSSRIYANQIDVWQQTLDLNQQLKKTAVKLENRSFSAGAKYEYSQETSLETKTRIEFNLEIEETIAIEAGAEIGGSGISGGVEIKMGLGIGAAQEIQITQTNTTGYVLDDDDLGDFFSVDIKRDLVYGTPVFDLVAGRSSCPWEPGSQPRDGVQLGIDTYVQNYVPPDQPATFILSLGNTSQSDEIRDYEVRMIHGSNPDGAIVRISGVALGNAVSYSIPAGEQFTAALTVERGPLANDYENLQIMMSPPCEYELWQDGAPLTIVDTVTFSVHFESPGSQISMVLPENNWVINQSNNDSLQIVIGNYNLNNPYMQSIKFQYRRTGEGWTTYYYVARKDIPPEYVTFFWDVANLPDGNYELRAVNDCGTHGVNYSTIAAGIIDRQALIVMGYPEPADGICNLGEQISISFSSDLDCGLITPTENVSLLDESGDPIAINLTCYHNQLVIIPNEPISNYENQMLTAEVKDIRGINGNILRAPVRWTFRVSNNPVYWLISNAGRTMYQSHGDQFTRVLKNAGGQDESFTIDRSPAWLSLVPLHGTIPPGGEQEITLTVDPNLNVGQFSDTVFAGTGHGDEYLLVTVNVLKEPPAWQVNPASYAFSMNVTAQLVLPDGLSNDPFDQISAFIGNECRGKSNVTYTENINKHLVYLTIYSNQLQGEPIEFRIWDASRGKEFMFSSGVYSFENNAAWGSATNPLLLEPNAYVQSIDLKNGWTWFSVNVQSPNATLVDALSNLTPANGDIIKGQDVFSQYDDNTGWQGTLTRLEAGKSYRIYLSTSSFMRYSGNPVTVAKTPLTINPGWTWIGYPGQEIMDLDLALQNFPANPGDRIRSQTEFAEYVNTTGTWEGSLEKLIPGQGYMIKSSVGCNLILPDLPKLVSLDPGSVLKYEEYPDWQVNISAFEYNMSVTAGLEFDKQFMTDTSVVLAAFCGDTCCGLAKPKYLEALDRYVTFLLVYSNSTSGGTIHFRIYDPAVGKIREVTETIVFSNDDRMGSLSEPQVLTAEGIGDELVPYNYYLRQNHPNPFNPVTAIEYGIPKGGKVKLTVYNLLGQEMVKIVQAEQPAGRYSITFDAGKYQLASGIYFYQLEAGSYTTTRKMLLIR